MIQTFEQGARKIIFEPSGEVSRVTGNVLAKQYCNSAYLKTGTFDNRAFNPEFVRDASDAEKDYYNDLKASSIHAVIL